MDQASVLQALKSNCVPFTTRCLREEIRICKTRTRKGTQASVGRSATNHQDGVVTMEPGFQGRNGTLTG